MPPPDPAPAARCPHCGTSAELEPATLVRQRCMVCGGPRVPRDGHSAVVSREEGRALREARRLTFARAFWRIAAIAAGTVGLLSLTVALALVSAAQPALLVATLTTGLATLPLWIAGYAALRARRTRLALTAHLERAWLQAARSIVTSSPLALTPGELAEAMRVDEPDAERWLTHLAAEDLVRARISEDGMLRFEPNGADAPRLRVAAGATLLARDGAPVEAEAEAAEDHATEDTATAEPPLTTRGQGD